jgi:lipopolysaccharide heptosyltransferase II
LQRILIIRFGALGDLCLLAWSLSHWARGEDSDQRHVTLVTKAAFAPLMEQMHGIDRVISLSEGGFNTLTTLASQLRSEKFDTIIDGHNILRSRLLLMLMGRRPAARLKKDTAARLALLGFKKGHRSLDQTMRDRFDALFSPLASLGPADSPAPLFHLRSGGPVAQPMLGLAPGAQWDSKRWPDEKFARLLQDFSTEKDEPVRLFLGPREETWFPTSQLSQLLGDLPRVEVVRGRTLTEIAKLLAGCSVVVTNDSGLLHLAEATGTPVLAFFGPTVQQFGYFPRLPKSRTLEVELECRPCSRNGKRTCHRGDLLCLQSITPHLALENLQEMLGDTEYSP